MYLELFKLITLSHLHGLKPWYISLYASIIILSKEMYSHAAQEVRLDVLPAMLNHARTAEEACARLMTSPLVESYVIQSIGRTGFTRTRTTRRIP